MNKLKKIDPELAGLIELEIKRQEQTIDLIPSECLVPVEILGVLGSPLVNKYSEGEVGERYYRGNKYYDEIESLAKQRALQAFRAPSGWGVNVQALSGTPANLSVYLALLKIGDTIMGMDLFSGGHLSHGHKASATGKLFKSVKYKVGDNDELDFERIEKIAREHKPKIIVSGFSAYPRQINFKRFGEIAKQVGALHMADISHIAGLVSAGEHMSPFEYADIVTTTTHKTLNGPRAAMIFAKNDLLKKINKMVFPGIQGGPHNNKIAAMALALKIAQTDEFKIKQKQIVKNAKIMANALKNKGFNLVGNGTETHLILVDLRDKNILGRQAAELLERAGIIVNRNSIPQDNNPFNPSGIRLGSPSLTFRNMGREQVEQISDWIGRIIIQKQNPEEINKEVKQLCEKFPLPYDY